MKFDQSGLDTVLPCQVIKGIWEKAAKLLKNFGQNVCPAPSSATNIKAFSVLNQNEKGRIPYYMEVHESTKTGSNCVKITCTCPMYKPNEICSHCVAVSDKCGVLSKFLEWRSRFTIII